MICSKLAFSALVLGSLLAWTQIASAQVERPPTDQVAQVPLSPAPPTAPSAPTPPAGAAPGAQVPDNAIGSVASLQGSASVTRHQAASALALRDAIFKGDTLQTGVDGTLGITFDDETTFTLRPNSQIAVDDFVYQDGGAHNAAIFNVLRGTVAFVAAEVAHTGNMKIDTPTSSLGIRGTTGLVEVPAGGAAGGAVSIKLYPDADGRVGRIEVFGRDGARLGLLDRGATGFAIRPGALGAAQRFTAVPLQISAQEADRDRAFVRQAFTARLIGRQINIQRRNNVRQPNQLRPNEQRPNQLRPNELRPNQLRPNEQRPNELRPNELRPNEQRPNELRPNEPRPGQPGRQLPGFRRPPGQPPQPGARPLPQRPPGGLPGPRRAPGGERRQNGRQHR